MRIETKDDKGRPNGWLIPLWNVNQRPELRPDQVYVTAVAPFSRKGPHLHMRRRGCFVCIQGRVTVAVCEGHVLTEMTPGEMMVIPPGVAAALYNFDDQEALVINMPSPAWSGEDQDEHPVENWQHPKGRIEK